MTTKKPKLPTLAQLRKLAKRKGMRIQSHKYRRFGPNGTTVEQLNVFDPWNGMPLVGGYSYEVPIRPVVFAALSALPDATTRRLKPIPWSDSETVHRYTPAKPQRVCVWYQDGEDSFWVPGCVGLDGAWEFTADGPKENSCTYCMRCGGKIKVSQ
jgi:hypothetical protein